MEAAGYGQYLEPFVAAGVVSSAECAAAEVKSSSSTETAVLAGGCFWGVDELFRKMDGVVDTTAGYTGGALDDPTYNDVKTGSTGHAEAVEIVFDPSRVSYEEILGYFFRLHDPTQLNRQMNDRGTQYRSAIFFHSDSQREIAERVREDVDKSGKWDEPVVTEVVEATTFYRGEDYHQDYLQRNPYGYNCHFVRD